MHRGTAARSVRCLRRCRTRQVKSVACGARADAFRCDSDSAFAIHATNGRAVCGLIGKRGREPRRSRANHRQPDSMSAMGLKPDASRAYRPHGVAPSALGRKRTLAARLPTVPSECPLSARSGRSSLRLFYLQQDAATGFLRSSFSASARTCSTKRLCAFSPGGCSASCTAESCLDRFESAITCSNSAHDGPSAMKNRLQLSSVSLKPLADSMVLRTSSAPLGRASVWRSCLTRLSWSSTTLPNREHSSGGRTQPEITARLMSKTIRSTAPTSPSRIPDPMSASGRKRTLAARPPGVRSNVRYRPEADFTPVMPSRRAGRAQRCVGPNEGLRRRSRASTSKH